MLSRRRPDKPRTCPADAPINPTAIVPAGAYAARVKVPGAPDLGRARETASRAASANTRRAYESDLKVFDTWCRLHGRVGLPCDEQTLCTYNEARARCGAKLNTVRRGMNSIRVRNRMHGADDPFADFARMHWTSLRKDYYAHPAKAAPLVGADIKVLCDQLGTRRLASIRARAVVLIGFAAGMRRSEIVAIERKHVEFVRTGAVPGVRIYLPRSKVDQEGKGRTVGIAQINSPYCPVRALELWLACSRIAEGYVFQTMRGRRLTGKPMDGGQVNRIVQRLALMGGLPKKDGLTYSAHSLRAGFVTAASEGGADKSNIAAQTGHTNMKQLEGYNRSDALTKSVVPFLGL